MIITIKNNKEYCTDNKLVSKKAVPCACVGFSNGLRQPGGDDSCTKCCGFGYTEEDFYPYEVSVQEANLQVLWHVFGIKYSPAGEVDPRRLSKALKKINLSLLVRGGREDGDTIYAGISPALAERYLREFKNLSDEACRREETIVWG